MAEMISVLLADDHSLMRETLVHWLTAQSQLSVVGAVDNADEAVRQATSLKPDVVILDIDMPGRHCFDAALAIKRQSPKTQVVFLSAFFNDYFIEQALATEASAYLTKNEPPSSVVAAIRAAASGGVYFSPEVQSRIIVDATGARLAGQASTRVSMLTCREIEVLRYLARGLSKKQIAQAMHISANTVDRHKANLMAKLDIHDRVELARFAIREGLAEP